MSQANNPHTTLAVHHCVGRVDDPEVKRKLEAEGWQS
jgi:hypothetical protein